MIKKIILLLFVSIVLSFGDTNKAPKSYILSEGVKVLYPNGKIMKIPSSMWLVKYSYGIELRQKAGLWVKNQPIYETKLTNREARIETLTLQVVNLNLRLENTMAINNYTKEYMKTMTSILGEPDKIIGRSNWKFVLGFALGTLFTLGTGITIGYVWKNN